jgi:hypothetical protein
MAIPAVSAKAEPGHARMEFYTTSSQEEFGLNKRSLRIARGDKRVTTPDGKKFCHDNSSTGKGA